MTDMFDDGHITSNNLVWWCKEESENESSNHQYEECNISAVIDASLSRIPILSDGNDRSNNGTGVENSPKVADISPFLALGRIRHHDCSLGRPQERGTYSENCSRGDNKSVILIMIIGQERRSIDCIPDATESKRFRCPEVIVDCSGEESNRGKCTIQSDIGIVSNRGINLSTTSETAEGIKLHL